MEILNGNIINKIPYNNLKKVTDLIDYEGPILSHFKDADENNYLYYWIDYDDSFNRWVIFKVKEYNLYEYLKGNLSLRQLILNKENEFIFTVDIDTELNYHNINLLNPFQLNEIYIPEIDSFYKYDIPELYQTSINKFEPSEYVNALREYALYLKIDPIENKYSETIGVEDAIDFLKNILNSYKKWISFNFYTIFKDKFSNQEKLNNAISKIKEYLSPRIVSAECHSFSIGLSSDFVMNDITDNDINRWRKNAISNYKEEVFDTDYNSAIAVKKIIDKYPEEDRKAIFEPVITAINSEKYSVTLTNQKSEVIKKINRINKKDVSKIIMPTIKSIAPEEEKKLITLLVEIDKENDLSKITKKDITQGLLFSEFVTDSIYKTDRIETKDYIIELNSLIECKIVESEDNLYSMIYEPLEIKVKGKSKDVYLPAFSEAFFNLYKMYIIDNLIDNSKKSSILNKLIKRVNYQNT